uniref:Uncharacterized protein n=1 Tax=Panagrolaimus sp. ES5 TaxID=591445 RepID=A0AC34GUV6_9BILA
MALNSTKETSGKQSGLFWAVSQSNLVIGGIFMYVVFRNTKRDEKDDISDTTVKILYSVFLGAILVGIGVLALLRVPEPASGISVPKKKPLKMIKSMFKLMFTKRMLVMAFVFAYVGVELSFWSGVYSNCISNTEKIGDNPKAIVALTAICEGLGLFTSNF